MTLQLRTLGTVDLRDERGEIRLVLNQPKRLALLVCLGAAGRHYVRRDTLLAWFWPDLDQDHARAALRRALYFLRRALGESIIDARGDEGLRLADDALASDVAAFERALASGDARTAMAIYDGDFLPGFYVAGAAEMERWIDQERERLRVAAVGACWLLAEAPGTPVTEAVAWAARAVSSAGEDEEAVRRQLELLERLGERAAAQKVYDAFARRLAADGLEPDPATTRVAARARTARPGAAGTYGASGEMVVLVPPFTVHGSEAFRYLAFGMSDLLYTALDGVEGLRVVHPRAWAAGGVGRPATTSEELAATHVLEGTVVEAARRLRVTAALRATSGAVVGRAEAQGPEDQLFEVVDEIARQLLAVRTGLPAERLSVLAARTTTSLGALKAYLRGERPFRLARYAEAATAFDEATQADPSFALAFYRIAAARAARVELGPARAASAQAMRHRARLADHDRLLVEAQAAWLGGRPDEAERRYGEVVAGYPDDLEAWYLLGDVHFHANPYRGRSIREAREPLERALALDPTHVGALSKLAKLDALEGRDADLSARVDQFLKLSPDADQSLAMRALRAWRMGRTMEKVALVTVLRQARTLHVAIAFGDLVMYAGVLDELESVGRAILAAMRSPELRALTRLMLAHIMLARGQHDSAREQLAAARRDDAVWGLEVQGLLVAMPFWPWEDAVVEETISALTGMNPTTVPSRVDGLLAPHDGLHAHIRWYLLGLLAARGRDGAGVAAAASQLEELDVPPEGATLIERMERSLAALMRRLRGDVAGALAAFEGARSDVWWQLAVASPVFAGTYERYVRAELLAACGRTEEARGWLAAIGERSPWELPFVGAARAALGAPGSAFTTP